MSTQPPAPEVPQPEEPARTLKTGTTKPSLKEPAHYGAAGIQKRKPTQFLDKCPKLYKVLQLLAKKDCADDINRVIAQAGLDDNSLLLDWKIQLTTSRGSLPAIKGQLPMHQIFHVTRRAEAFDAFDTLIGTLLMQPLNSQFQNLIQELVNDEPLNNADGSTARPLLQSQLSSTSGPRNLFGD